MKKQSPHKVMGALVEVEELVVLRPVVFVGAEVMVLEDNAAAKLEDCAAANEELLLLAASALIMVSITYL